MTKLIINADDFGLTPGVSRGIIYGFEKGIITSTTIMTNMPYFEDAVNLYQKYSINIGVHLTCTAGKPLTHCPNICNQEGNFIKNREYSNEMLNEKVIEELKLEWEAQIQKALQANIQVDHLDVHHHIYMAYPKLHPIIFDLARKYQLPIRIDHQDLKDVPSDIKVTDYFVRGFDHACKVNADLPQQMEEYLKQLFEKITQYEIVELMVHPAMIDQVLCNCSSMNIERMYTLATLLSENFMDLVNQYNIELISYGDL